jgi:hypothetical protein
LNEPCSQTQKGGGKNRGQEQDPVFITPDRQGGYALSPEKWKGKRKKAGARDENEQEETSGVEDTQKYQGPPFFIFSGFKTQGPFRILPEGDQGRT